MIKIEGLDKVLEEIHKERGVEKQVLKDAVAAALLSASKKKMPHAENLDAIIEEDGTVRILARRTVVMKVKDPIVEIAKKDAVKLKKGVKTGDEVQVDVTPSDFGRLAAQTAKQVIIQRIREAEKEGAYEEYIKKQGEIISGIVQRREMNGFLVNLGKVETLLPFQESIPGENYRPKDRIKVMVMETKKTPKGPVIVISRANTNFLKKLFELEVPEILSGVIEIKAISREPGRRSKVAVVSHEKNVGAVGTCIGHMGGRIQNIVKELNNERIDVIEWSDDMKTLITNSLSPAKISKIEMNLEEKSAKVIVQESQLSLAIGKEGQNVRLAAKLTGWRIDIISEEGQKKVAEAKAETEAKAEAKVEAKALEEVKEEIKAEEATKTEEINEEEKNEEAVAQEEDAGKEG